MTPAVEKAAIWLDRQVSDMSYGEASIRVIVHAGRLRIEKTVTIKEQIQE